MVERKEFSSKEEALRNLPKNGIIVFGGVTYRRNNDGIAYSVRTGEEISEAMSRAESEYMNEALGQFLSLVKSPMGQEGQGAQRSIRAPKSFDD